MCDQINFVVCRLCLNSGEELINICDGNNKSEFMLKKTIEDLINVKVVEDKMNPWLVCSDCTEKLTEFRLFKHRCVECLFVFYNRIRKGSNPATKGSINNPEECPGEVKKEYCDDAITDDAIDMTTVDVPGDMIAVKQEEVDAVRGCSADREIDNSSSMVASMQEGESHRPGNEDSGNLNRSGGNELIPSLCVDVVIKEECDADISQGEGGLREEESEVQELSDDDLKQDGAVNDAGGTLLHACQFCYKVFTQMDLLRDHLKTIHLEKEMQYRCDACSEVFECENDLASHVKLAHALKEEHQCHQCYRIFENISELKLHMTRHSGEGVFKCIICSKGFALKSDVQSHMLTHASELPHKCEICSEEFSLNASLRQHMMSHTGERRHKCDICSKAFTENGILRRHMLTHISEKPHKCEFCPKAFLTNADIRRHMLVHSGEKPFKCDMCSKAFTQKCNLKIHMMTHTVEKSNKC